MLQGDYPFDSVELAERLVREQILTTYQARRFLSNRPHGLIVGRYIILDRIGSGSMGRVYKAHHPMMDRVVALKIISPEIASNERVVARFQREMKLVGRLDHPNVVRAFDADQFQRVLYIVMEYVPGHSLGERLKKGPIPPLEMVDYAAQAALGLAHAHEQGIVHRDIKPSNILLSRDGRIKILDLGLGVLMEADTSSTFATADGIAVGTVDYMSPEQACGRDVDGRSDVYRPRLRHVSPDDRASCRSPAPRRSSGWGSGSAAGTSRSPSTCRTCRRTSSALIDKMMAHKPHERFSSATELADALQNLIRPRARSIGPATAPAPAVGGGSSTPGRGFAGRAGPGGFRGSAGRRSSRSSPSIRDGSPRWPEFAESPARRCAGRARS